MPVARAIASITMLGVSNCGNTSAPASRTGAASTDAALNGATAPTGSASSGAIVGVVMSAAMLVADGNASDIERCITG